MVRVPEYNRNVLLRPGFQSGVEVRASPDAFGAGVGRGMQDLARGVGQMGDALAQVQALEDEAAVRNARNQFIERADSIRYDATDGYLTKEGKGAVDAFPDYQRKVGVLRQQVAEGARLTPQQQKLFAQTVAPLETDARRQGLIHKSGALKAYIVNDLKSSTQVFANQAMMNADDPVLVGKYIAAGQLEIRRQGELQGWGADTLGLQESEFVSGVHKNITLRMAQNDPLAADAYMKKNANMISGADQYALKGALDTEIKVEQSKQEADRILSGGRSDVGAADLIAPAGDAQAGRTIGASGPSKVRAFLTSKAPRGAYSVDNLDEAFATNLAAMMQDAPPEIREGLGLLSGHRSFEHQTRLFNNSNKSGRMVARPGHSNHEVRADGTAKAVDLNYNGQRLDHAPKHVRDWVHANAKKYGMYFPMGWEPWHIEPTGTRGGAATSGTVAPRNQNVAPRATMPSFDDIETKLAGIKDPDVRDLTRKRLYAAMEGQSKAAEQQEKASKAELWKYIDQGATPDQVPMEVRQAAGMAAVSSAWEYMNKAASGREVDSDETMLYDMRRFAATEPGQFAEIDLNDYRDRLSKNDIKELTGLQTGALTDQRKAKEDGINLTAAFTQSETQLAAIGLSTAGKTGGDREATAKRIAQFQNSLAAEMEAFKRANDGRNPTQMDIQSMVNRMLLPIVMSHDVERSFFDPAKSPGNQLKTIRRDGFFFEGGAMSDGETADVAVEYTDIPIDLRRGISVDLESELGRKPSEDEVVQRYEDFIFSRPPTPIERLTPRKDREPEWVETPFKLLTAPLGVPLHYGERAIRALAGEDQRDVPESQR